MTDEPEVNATAEQSHTAETADAVARSKLADRLMNEVYPEFAEHLPPEVAEAVITAEVGRWQGVKVPDFVAVFAARRVRARLRHDSALYGGSVA
jgi:hypothetical protein